MANVILKGKTLVPQGRNRGRGLDGKLVRWTSDDQVVEVSEAEAKLIEADKLIVAVRLEPPPAPAAPKGK